MSSLLCGLAPSLPLLLFFRAVQGIGGGGLQPMAQAILNDTFPPEKRGQCVCCLRRYCGSRPYSRAHARRLDYGQLLLALDIFHYAACGSPSLFI